MKRARRPHRWRRSLGARIVAVFVLLALATTVVFVAGVQRVMRGGWEAYARPLVADYADRVVTEIGSPPDVARAQAIVDRLPLALQIDGPAVHWRSHPEAVHRYDFRRDGNDDYGFGLTRTTADGHRIVIGLAEPASAWRSRAFTWITLAVLLALLLFAWGWVRRQLRPIDDIRAGAERFGSGDFARPIPRRRDDELGDLAGRINTMAASLRDRLESQRALLLAISHELRSPLTRARVNAELVAEGASRVALLHDLAEMRDLIEELLESERLAAGGEALRREPVDVAALVDEVLAASFAQREVRREIDASLPTVPLDAMRIRLLLRNLVDNAWRHGGRGVTVFARRDGAAIELGVRDRGAGVAPDQLARLGEPFWRPDAARSREAGGVGLGLYLCRLVARAHGGSLEFRDAAPGLEAVARLPIDAGDRTS